MPRNKIDKRRDEDGLTQRQEVFLRVYPETLSIYKAAKMAGIHKGNILRDLRADTPFGRNYRTMAANVEGDPRYNKIGSIFSLQEMLRDMDKMTDEEMRPAERMKMRLEIQKELNKMIEGNLASTKRVVENIDIDVKAVYDFTKLDSVDDIKTIDIEAEEV